RTEEPQGPGANAALGQGRWGRRRRDHLLHEPVARRSDGLCRAGGGGGADRDGCDGGGVQGDCQAAAVWLGDEVEGSGSGGGVELAVLELHTAAVVAVLGEDRSLGVSGGGLKDGA